MLERKRNYTKAWHQTLDGSLQRKEEMCVRVCKWPSPGENTLQTKWWDALTCSHTHILKHTRTETALWSKNAGSTVPSTLNEWMENNGRASGVPVMDRCHYKPISSGYWRLTSDRVTQGMTGYRVCVSVCLSGCVWSVVGVSGKEIDSLKDHPGWFRWTAGCQDLRCW